MNGLTVCCPQEHSWSRRQILSALAGAAGAAWGATGTLTPPVFAAERKQRRKQVLFVWIDGGMSQLESWDPKPNSVFGGPFRAIPTSVPGIHISELMPRTAQVMHHLALLRSVHTQDNSHSAGVGRIQRGDPKNRGVTYPFFGSAVAKLLGPGDSGLPPYVSIKPGAGGFVHADAGFLGPQYGAVVFGDGQPPENLVPPKDLLTHDAEERDVLRRAANTRYARGRRTNMGEATSYVFDVAQALMQRQELFDTAKFDPRDVERYGIHEFGRHMLQARQMLEAGITFVKVTSFGWDTHGDNFNGHLSLMPKFDQAFAAMIADLADRSMLDDVLVIAMSEFGRTPRINGHIGRDHWPEAWSVAMAGSGLKRGVVVGKTNDQGTYISTDEHDIGALFHTWFACLGIDTNKTEYNNAGQPLPLAHDGMRAISDLLA